MRHRECQIGCETRHGMKGENLARMLVPTAGNGSVNIRFLGNGASKS